MILNPLQQRAVDHIDGPCLCLAGPGSGKTKVLTLRVQNLINKGINPVDIVVITFTKAAAIEMKERFVALSNQPSAVTFATFHSLFWGILQQEKGYKASDIVMGSRRLDLIKEAVNSAGINETDKDMVTLFSTNISYLSNLSFEKRKTIHFENFHQESLKVAEKYKSLKKKYHLLDFDDMLEEAYLLFQSNEAILKKWQDRFNYFLIDEMQDMNELQFDLVKLLSVKANNVFAVGDDDQSIYGFRGANPGLMQDFQSYYKDCLTLVLNINYRSPSNVVEIAKKLIDHNTNRFAKDIMHNNPPGQIVYQKINTGLEEGAYVCQKVEALVKEGDFYDSIAVLYRNHSDARFLVESFLEKGIPFFIKDQMPNIYTHFIIEDLECYFQIAIGNKTRKRILRILNRPNRYLHRQCAQSGKIPAMKAFYFDNPQAFRRLESMERDLELIAKMSPYAAINYILNIVGYKDFLKEYSLEQGAELREYMDIVGFVLETVKDCRTINKALEKLDYLRLKVDYENKAKANERSGKVGLYTLHSSKGLEFDNVFIIGVNEGSIPYRKAVSKEDIEGERRLFYVGITRTKKRLFLSSLQEKNRDRLYPSRFINELGIED